jgi:hypothetical protein
MNTNTLPAVLLVFLSFTATAEKFTSSTELISSAKAKAYVTSPSMMQIYYQLGIAQDKKFGIQTDCKTNYDVQPLFPVVISPIDFPEDKQNPTTGTWFMRYDLKRCGEAKTYSAIFLANADGSIPKSQPYYPGSTGASALLIKDTMMGAIPYALTLSENKDCKNINIFDMRITETPHNVVEGDKTFKGVWSEAWTFKVCGQQIDVPISFIPDANGGTTYSIKKK